MSKLELFYGQTLVITKWLTFLYKRHWKTYRSALKFLKLSQENPEHTQSCPSPFSTTFHTVT